MASGRELLIEDAFFEIVLGIKQKAQTYVPRFLDVDFHHLAYFGQVGNGTDGALVVVEDFEFHLGIPLQERAAPASWPKGADWRQGQRSGIERQDGAMGGEIVGRAAGGCCHHHAVADQLVYTHSAVDMDPDLGGLAALSQKTHLVDGDSFLLGTGFAQRAHPQWMQCSCFRSGQPFGEKVDLKAIHQESNRTLVHTVDWNVAAEIAMQRAQHEAVTTKGDDHIGFRDRNIRIALLEKFYRFLSVVVPIGKERDLFIRHLQVDPLLKTSRRLAGKYIGAHPRRYRRSIAGFGREGHHSLAVQEDGMRGALGLIVLLFLTSGAVLAAGEDTAGGSGERHEGYYYPEVTSREVYGSRANQLKDATRSTRLAFVTGLTQQQLAKPYAPTFAIFAKGEQAEKLIIVSLGDQGFRTLYQARGLLAQLTATARTAPLVREMRVEELFTFFDLLRLIGFQQVTVSDGEVFAHQILLE